MPYVSDMPARRPLDRGAARANRRRAMPRWAIPAMRLAAMATPVLTLAGFAVWLWQAGWLPMAIERGHEALAQATVRAGYGINEVMVEGRAETSRDAILDAIDIHYGDSILDLDLQQARDDLEKLPWVATAMVERKLPNTLYIRITERKPWALWQHEKKLMVIDQQGQVLTDRGVDRFGTLLQLVGPNAPRHAQGLFDVLEAVPEVAKRVEAAVWVGDRRWDLRLSTGVYLKLPETDVASALRQFADMESKHRLIDRDVVAIDLRLPDRMAIQTAQPVAKPRRVPEEKI